MIFCQNIKTFCMLMTQFWLLILKFVRMNTLCMCFSNMQAHACSFLPSFIVKFILVYPITAEERESCIEPYTLIILCSKNVF